MRKSRIIGLFCLGLMLSPEIAVQAQVLKDTATFRQLCQGVDYIYNLQFNQAREVYTKISTKYPEHPMIYVFRGLITYWENFPLTPASGVHGSFEDDMRRAIEKCEEKSHPEDLAEYLLTNLGARGMLLLYYADNDVSKEVFSMASSTYQLLKQSFSYTDIYPDFYFFTGLYNYYREAYPEAHPVYKALAFLFPKGNKVKGLAELQIASKKAIVLKAEAFSFLSGIYISFENNYPQASKFSKALHELYPRNTQYLAVYIKNLLLVKDYNTAEMLINSSRRTSNNAYFQAQLSILNGILQEKKYKNLNQARTYYSRGLKDISAFGAVGNEFQAYACFGLSRISEANDDKQGKRTYRKHAMELASYENVNFDE